MIKLLSLLLMLLLLAACGAGGGTVAGPGLRLQTYWPEIGVDRYEAVVFPAETAGPRLHKIAGE